MKVWQKHPIYGIIHVLFGVGAYFSPVFLVIVLSYQLLQYCLCVRFFAFEQEIRQGNSLEHTMLKLSEIAIGYILAPIFVLTWNTASDTA
jgi:hypothetical protein